MSALEERVKGVLVSEEEAKEIVERLGKQISKDYEQSPGETPEVPQDPCQAWRGILRFRPQLQTRS